MQVPSHTKSRVIAYDGAVMNDARELVGVYLMK
jgi:hypothetical protein